MTFVFLDSLVLYYAFIIRDFQKNRYRIIVRKGSIFSRFSGVFSIFLQIIVITPYLCPTLKIYFQLFLAIFRYFYKEKAKNHQLSIFSQKLPHLFLLHPLMHHKNLIVLIIYQMYICLILLIYLGSHIKTKNISHIFACFCLYKRAYFRKMLKVLLSISCYTI